jgi:hypothetical protein
MFIPPGETIHENLATSYVLVDAMVADFCEGGFSGVIEVVLRDTDSFIIIASGNVAAVFDKQSSHSNSSADINYIRTTVEQLAERARRERGRVSIYGYSEATASAVAGRINAKPLYVGLSTEFTDLGKMISKLVRERDREWFIDVKTEGGPGTLIQMRDDECRIIKSTGYADSGALDLASNPALGHLVGECNRTGGTFDVYFTQPAETIDPPEQNSSEYMPASRLVEDATVNDEPVASEPVSLQHAASEELTPSELRGDFEQEPEAPAMAELNEPTLERAEQLGASVTATAASTAKQSSFAPPVEIAMPGLAGGSLEPQGRDFSLVLDELPTAGAEVEAMAEIKRLMAEIARAIEQAAQAVGRPDSFSMSLRAGQLTIADRFPFLDPFAGEFEYLAGEIVFVGHATAEEFVAGLAEALKLAMESVTRSTAYADRFRSYVIEDLQKLFARERAGFERFGLEEVIHKLITF